MASGTALSPDTEILCTFVQEPNGSDFIKIE
ncbi:hypothetical protein AVEN_265421-1, partial [Araneus ventricosus]